MRLRGWPGAGRSHPASPICGCWTDSLLPKRTRRLIEYPAIDRLPVPLFRAAEDGRLTWINEAWKEALASTVGEFWFDAFSSFDATSAASTWHSCVIEQTPINLSSPAQGLSGETLFFDVVIQPAVAEGRAEILGALVDVTEQTVALAETNAILDTAVDGIIIIDERGKIETFNQAA
ncbi:MAG: PAS domain-containing protein, partial [Gammaproteobacteria bacterium]